ncbi:MAG: class I SAM-dependent methyltransferase [Deltaproteobacteria bacterium]|nr:class I SAM-dependent methyltransferase [Deltaproteobacteria bacterium]
MASASKSKTERVETRPGVLRAAAERRVLPQMQGSGRIAFKAIPALIDTYVERVHMAFQAVGKPCDQRQLDQLRAALEKQLGEAFAASPQSWIVVDYQTDDPPKETLSYVVDKRIVSLAQEYQDWVEAAGPGPLFGKYPDAKVMDVASTLGAPPDAPVLDVGAGTGRNSLALARAGHPVTVLELSPRVLEILRKEHAQAGLPVDAIEGDVLDARVALPSGFRLVVLSEVLSNFVDRQQLRTMFGRMTAALAPGGTLLLNCFLAHPSYTPDRVARDVSRAYGCAVFTRSELAEAVQGSDLELMTDESARDYEKEHLPPDRWPPTTWFDGWSQGRDVFRLEDGKSPVEMRWLTYRKRD